MRGVDPAAGKREEGRREEGLSSQESGWRKDPLSCEARDCYRHHQRGMRHRSKRREEGEGVEARVALLLSHVRQSVASPPAT